MTLTDSIYGGTGVTTGGTNQFGFKPQPTQDNNPLANFLQTNQNLIAGQGVQDRAQGKATTGAGIGAMAPVLQYLTQLTNGDQADLTQATQPQANQIKDSFAAIRSMISQQPRGGGKAGVLAEAPYKERQQVSDMQSQVRAGAGGQLGNLAATLAGLGLDTTKMGLSEQAEAVNASLSQRGQNIEESAANKQPDRQYRGAARLT